MNANAADRDTTESTFVQQMPSIEATIEMNQGSRELKVSEDKLENAELRFRNEKICDMEKQHEARITHLENELKAERKEKVALQNDLFQAQQRIADFEKQHKEDKAKSGASSSSNEIEDSKSLNGDDGPLVIKKLDYSIGSWFAYSTLDEMELPKTIRLNNHSKYLLFDYKKVSRKLVLNGVVNQRYDLVPFVISHLLKHVESCNLTHLDLRYQKISWSEYKKLVSAGNVKNLSLKEVAIKKQNDTFALLEEIMRKLPNIEQFECSLNRISETIKLTKRTFTNILKLQKFENLQKFNLIGITFDSFDANSSLDFMKKHPDAEFRLSFHYHKVSEEQKIKIKATAAKLREAHPDKLNITYFPRYIVF